MVATVFDTVWLRLPIPGEFDTMDACDQSRWRSVIEQAFYEGVRIAQTNPKREAEPLSITKESWDDACAGLGTKG